MGVHITFVRSAVIDGWSEEQILHMMVGGNGKARQYFKKKGWTDWANEQRTAMYTSSVAKQYKDQIQKDIGVQRATLIQTLQEETKPVEKKKADVLGGMEGLDDLISGLETQSIAAPVKKPLVIKPIAKPVQAAAEPTKRTVIKTDKTKAASKKAGGAMSLSSKKPKGGTANLSTRKAKPKISAVVDDDDVEDDFDKMAADAQRDAKERAKNAEENELRRIAAENKKKEEKKKQQEKEADDRLKSYSNATSLSSDQYFQRGNYAETSAEDKERLGNFSNANAIGSDAFFGREEDQGGARGSTSDLDFQDLKAQAYQKSQQLGSFVGSLYSSVKSRYGES